MYAPGLCSVSFSMYCATPWQKGMKQVFTFARGGVVEHCRRQNATPALQYGYQFTTNSHSSLTVVFQCVLRVCTCRRVRGSSARACRVPSVLTVMRWEPKAARTARCGGRPLLCQRPPPPTVVSSTSYLFPK